MAQDTLVPFGFSSHSQIMNRFLLALVFLSVANAMPRYVLVPIEDLQLSESQPIYEQRPVYRSARPTYRMARAAWPQGDG